MNTSPDTNVEPPTAVESSRPTPQSAVGGKPYFSRAGFLAGAVAMMPVTPSLCVFGLVFGTLASQKALTLVETLAMSALVYGGLAQMVSLQSWPGEFTFATLSALALVTLTVNSRLFLMSLTFRPWLSELPAWQAYPTLLFVTDVAWLRAMRYRSEGGSDVGFFLGGGLLLYAIWLLSTGAGVVFAGWLTNPKAFGIDLLIPAFFATLLIPAWRGARPAIPWLIAGLVAVAVNSFVTGYWYIIAGAVSGAITAGLIGDE
jgi:predicted branched-subunit amino acid permease